MARQEGEQHSHKEIGDYVARNYPELKGNTVGMSIGLLGGNYRVIVTDTQHVNHTLKIDPKEIDADREARLKSEGRTATARDSNKLDRARKAAAAFKAKLGRGTDRDHDREQ